MVGCSSEAERQQLCERLFRGGEEELGLLEALKLLMLARAVELHGCMQAGGEVPIFCWLLFARDSSDCPRSFLANHLSHVGLSAGLEQVGLILCASQQMAGILRRSLDFYWQAGSVQTSFFWVHNTKKIHALKTSIKSPLSKRLLRLVTSTQTTV